MVTTKTCEGCGWVYPINYPERRCRFCGTVFKKRFCTSCGEYTETIPNRPLCRKCESARTNDHKYKDGRFYRRSVDIAVNRFNEWLSLLGQVPANYHTLTEDEWIKACSYFGKCALCNNDGIDARAYFIAYQLGGRYNAGNVIPVCDKCATSLKIQQNPFIKYNAAWCRDRVENIVAYLKPIILEEINDGPCSKENGIQDIHL